MSDVVLKFLGEVLAYAGGGAVVAYLLFQYFGSRWIEAKFAERLEHLRHAQALEVQRLRVEIDSMLGGALKLQEHEFEALPEAWRKLDEAHGLVRWLTSPGQQYPDVDRMSGDELEEFLDGTDLSESQKKSVRSASRKLDAYMGIIFWHRLHQVQKAIGELQTFVARNSIFFPLTIKEKFSEITSILWSAVISKEVGHEAKDWKMQNEGWKEVQEKAEPLYKAIESEIQARLASHGRRREGA